MKPTIDAQARARAIHPRASFLVQAPAGSGKTELLIQRILALLATVEEPEEILALTFTRKAAAEMRERVIKALASAQQPQPAESHAHTTWQLSSKVLKHAEKHDWNLINYPARLRIMTLDAFASGLARQLPLLSGFGQTPATSDFAEPMYLQAVDDLMHLANQKQAPLGLHDAMSTLILHQNCNIEKLKRLLASMLSRREQWLPDILKYSHAMPAFREMLENNMGLIIEHALSECALTLTPEQKKDIFRLGSFAAQQLTAKNGDNNHPLAAFLAYPAFPDADTESVEIWKAIVHLLMTTGEKADFRKPRGVDARLGFNTDKENKPYKTDVIALLESCQENMHLKDALLQVRQLPSEHEFTDVAWHTLEALFLTLKLLAGQLWSTFEQHKQVDFTEIMLRAKQALGQTDTLGNVMPSEALLRLDYQIKHILIDEFQDTSTLQIDMLSRLTTGWEPKDPQRTLFMVGDPMQSIYRFREAKVSLFLQAALNQLPEEQAIPEVTSLKLAQNFRSSPEIISWVNETFAQIFPKKDDVLSGAISYTPSAAHKADKGLVSLNILSQKSDQQEADLILNLIQNKTVQGKRVGVLARSRSHLKTLMQTLQHHHVPFRALDVLPLNQQPEIIDLLSLTSALLHPADHIAWAALLRSPVVGLSKAQLFDIFNAKPLSPWKAIQSFAKSSQKNKTEGENQKAKSEVTPSIRFVAALEPCLKMVRRMPLRKLVESTWLRLAAPAVLSKNQLSNADTFFNLLERLEDNAQVDITLLKQRLQQLYAKPEIQAGAEQVELLTMHSAKGLQWDTVILCGLGKTPRAKDKRVLVQTEVSSALGQHLLLSPLPQFGNDFTYDLIRNFEKQRDQLEVARLMYVACTRAEKELHLFGDIRDNNEEPAAASLLALLWRDSEHDFLATEVIRHAADTVKTGEAEQDNPIKDEHQLTRLPFAYQPPSPHTSITTFQLDEMEAPNFQQLEFTWAGAQAKAMGIALHAALQKIAESGLLSWKTPHDTTMTDFLKLVLLEEGISKEYMAKTLSKCMRGLKKCFNSEQLQWILSEQHQDQHNEWALTLHESKGCKHMVLDRSFIDSGGTRWVIDYKTGAHFDDNLDAFLDQELKRYTIDTPQLPNYVKVLKALEPNREVKAALYFPMVDGWRVWE